MSIRQKAYELWLHSPLMALPILRRRDMAYLVTYRRYDELRLEDSKDMLSCFDAFAQTLFGWPVYIGPWAPPDGILFLPERTIASMAHGYPPELDVR